MRQRFDFDPRDSALGDLDIPPRSVLVPRPTWWQAMPWVVRAALWVTAFFTLLPIVLMIAATAIAVPVLGVLFAAGVL